MARALLFPGQGAQYVGMGRALAERYSLAHAILAEADEVLGVPLSRIMAEGPEAELTRTDISQPAILVHSWMAFQVLREVAGDPAPAACAGLSLGEYTALLVAGALHFTDALQLVRLRGEAMQAAADARAGGMVALIGIDEAGAAALCRAVRSGDEVLQVANLNSPGQVVIAGDKAACERAAAAAKDHGARRALPLTVAGAFHSPHMAPAAERLREAIGRTELADPRVPVYSNVTAAPVRRAPEIPDLLVKQLTHPVRWADSVMAMKAAGIAEFWELGPGKTLSGMVARTVTEVEVRNVDAPEDLAAFAG